MGDLTRSTGPVDDDWAATPAPEHIDPQQRLAAQAEATETVAHAIHQIASGLNDLDQSMAGAAEALSDELDYTGLADTIAWLHDARGRLATLESYVSRELGRMDGCPDTIALSDGRVSEVMKGKDRKAWRHDDWKRDVRVKMLEGINDAYVMVDADGAPHEPAQVLGGLLADVQAVHGSTAPKATVLKALGLSADDYCESYPGPYSLKITAKATTTD